MASVKVNVCYLISIIGSIFWVSGDPCLTSNHQELGDLLKRGPAFTMDSAPLCDYYLTEGWYSAPSYLMPTSPPGLMACGTLYPFWMKGVLPSTVGTEIDVEICGVGFSSTCQKTFNIRVKKCSNYFIYKLKSLDSCNSAYCFEKRDSCVTETPSNLQVVYQGVSYTKVTNSNGVQWNPIVELLCQFTPLSDNTLYYHIDWYVDNTRIIENQTVDSSTLGDAVLTTKDLFNAGRKIGCSIHCVVGAKRTVVDSPCNSTSSALFFAGIEVLTPLLNMSRKGETTLRIRPTIPYATHTLELPAYNLENTGALSISLDFPANIITACTTAGSSRVCEIKIPSFKYSERHKYNDRSQWHKEYPMEIQNKDNLGYKIDNSLLLRLKTLGGGEEAATVYEGVLLPDVPINIVDDHTEWKGKYCYSHADPHMRSFDGYLYECQHVGCKTGITSVLYQNKEHDQEVQVRHHKCFWPNARCICALAARSGKDVFIFDACNGRRYINFPICHDKSLKVIKATDMSYKIFFPTGTYVTTTLHMYSDWFLQTEVYPSVADVGKSSGLCGVLGGGIQNDLIRRDGTVDNPNSFSYHYPPDDFSISWRVPAGDDLFSASMDFESLNSLSLIKTQLCTCNHGKTECSYRSYTNCGTTTRGKEYQCLLHSSNSRRKRHAEYMTTFIPDPVENESPLRIRRQAAYTDEEVVAICNSDFDQSIPFQTCLEHVADFSNDSIQNCIADVSLTGNPNLTSFHLESAITECQTFIILNSTLQKEKPAITYEILSVCSNNCSNHGECSNGNCSCNTGFGGSDCSFDITSPPTVTSLLGNGLCDRSEDTCDDVTMFGQYFVENMNTTCFMTRNEISVTNNLMEQNFYETRLEERTLYEGFCDLLYKTNNTWVTQFAFNMSNDKMTFTNTFNVFVYQSECQIVNNDTNQIYFTLQNGFCFINGKCIRENTNQSNESCSKCKPGVNQFNWTNDCTNETASSSATTVTKTTSLTTIKLSSTTKQTTTLNGLTSSTAKQTSVPLASTTSSQTTSGKTSTTDSSSTSFTTTTPVTSKQVSSASSGHITSTGLMSSSAKQTTASSVPLTSTTISTTTSQLSSGTESSKATFTTATSTQTKGQSSTSAGFTSSTTQITTTSSPEPSTLTSTRASGNKKMITEDKLSSGIIGLIVAIVIVTLVIMIVTIYMIKSKFNNRSAMEAPDEVNIYPKNKDENHKDVFQGENLLKFESPTAMYSRPPSAHSLRPDQPTVDLSKLYGSEKLDQLFGVQN